jgi:hypothetical protein
MLPAQLPQFRALVFAEPLLQAQLQAATETGAFIACALQIAHDHGIALTQAELNDALRSGYCSWLERWL